MNAFILVALVAMLALGATLFALNAPTASAHQCTAYDLKHHLHGCVCTAYDIKHNLKGCLKLVIKLLDLR